MTATAIPIPIPLTDAPSKEASETEAQRYVVPRSWDEQRIDAWLLEREQIDLSWRWRAACEHVQLGHIITTPLGGSGRGWLPLAVHVEPARTVWDSGYLIVRLPPGVAMADLEYCSEELAGALKAWRLRFSPRGPDFVRVDIVQNDPLGRVVSFLPPAPSGHVVLGVDEWGDTVSTPLEHLTHSVFQGATRSGKSAMTYQLLAQLCRRSEVDVAGIDPTGLLLRPFGRHPRGWRVCGTEDLGAYELAMAGVVAEMDRRIAAMPPRRDTVQIGPHCPLILVVLEEWAGVARLVGHTRQKPSPVHKHVARLLAEGAKAGIRVLTIVQRAEADVVGAFERDQALTRLSFAVNDENTLKMLHPDIGKEQAEQHATSPKGVALLTAPGVPLVRLRAPWIGGYGEFVDAVAGNDAA